MANWASVDRLGDPSQADWQRKNLTWIEPTPGQRWQVYVGAAPAFQGLLSELAAGGYPIASSGGFNYRTIRGGDKLSQHAFGTAIDLNAATNPRLQPGQKVVTDLPADIGEIAAKYGLEWGGNWTRPDAMHFEWTGGSGAPATAPVAAPAVASGAPPSAIATEVAQLFGGASPATAAAAPGATAAAPQDQPMTIGGVPLGRVAAQFMRNQNRRSAEEQAAQDADEQQRRTALLSTFAKLYGA